MDNEFQKKRTDEKGKNKPVGLILFSSLALLLLFIGELYVMVIMQKEGFIEVSLIGVAILVFAYLDLSSIIKWIHINEEDREEQYAGMLKAEKASYLLIRKYFDEIEEQLALMEDKVSDPFQEIVAAQKATAKVTINRNKENTDALMNSNDKLLDIIFGMESKIEELSETFAGGSYGGSTESNAGLAQKQSEISDQMRELEINLKNQISQIARELSNVSSQIAASSRQMALTQQDLSDEPEPLGDLGALGDLEDFATLEADVPMDDLPELDTEETVAPLPEVETEPLPGLEPLSESEEIGETDLTAEPLSELEPMPEPLSELEPMPEPLSELEPMSEPLSELEPIAEPLSELESVSEPEAEPEKPPMPDLSDPNRSMSPDEIAALFANLG